MIKNLDERVIKNLIDHVVVSNSLLEDQFQILPARMADIRAQDSEHKVTVRFFEPTEFEIIALDAKARKQFIAELTGPI